MAKPWHTLEIDEVLKELNVNREGLSSQEAHERLAKYGYNEIKKVKRRTALHMFLEEFKDIFILLLIAATIFSAVIGYWEMMHGGEFVEAYADTITIGAIVVLCAVTGFVRV